ncbi:unnamed protein product [Rhizophagus irregularis]|nr:unnamed protein product [Rhizophagus irregularis]
MSVDPTYDKNALKNLFKLGFINPYPSSVQNPTLIGYDEFLSVIAHQFSYQELQNRLGFHLQLLMRQENMLHSMVQDADR